jgi:hypothetical protein
MKGGLLNVVQTFQIFISRVKWRRKGEVLFYFFASLISPTLYPLRGSRGKKLHRSLPARGCCQRSHTNKCCLQMSSNITRCKLILYSTYGPVVRALSVRSRMLSNLSKSRSLYGWPKFIISAPPRFGRHVKTLVPTAFAVVSTEIETGAGKKIAESL